MYEKLLNPTMYETIAIYEGIINSICLLYEVTSLSFNICLALFFQGLLRNVTKDSRGIQDYNITKFAKLHCHVSNN